MKQLQFRMFGIFFSIFVVFTIVFGVFLDRVLEEYTRDNQLSFLTESANVLAESLHSPASNKSTITNYLENMEQHIDDRITYVELDGNVIYDSQRDPEDLENHFLREEIVEVMAGAPSGSSIRISDSTQQELYYVAVPVVGENNELIAIVRLSRPLSEIGISNQIVQSLYYFIFIAILASFVLTYLLTRKVAKPIEDVMDVAHELSNQNYQARYSRKGSGDLQELGNTMNDLAENLENQTQELIQNDERLRKLINHLVIGVMLLNEQKEVTMVNEAMEKILHLPKEKIVGKTYLEAISSYGMSHLIERVYQTKKSENDEIYFYHPQEQVVDANIVPIVSRTPDETDLIVLLYDITEIRRLEKVRSDFVANVSHELRTPITALKGFSETLLDGAMEDKETLEQFLGIILKESFRLELLVNDILELSRLEQRQVPMNLEPVNLSNLVRETLALIQQPAKEKKMNVQFDGEEVLVVADPNRIKQILSNLINNALVYTPEEGTIQIFVDRKGKQAVLTITDNGIGISEEEINRVFERFYRIDKGRSRNSGGTGLGLSIVKYLIENMNGSITVKSKLGLGTTFTVKIPLA
ncbi:cell wall metabolism sensor histidine kinase WalK [Jeotgalibaca sp. MA1X17-3]|uniref:two-component system histidine kinase PnpS n=1 Tax=Jeotgalibaca sp. MA1X17-3 TaxID=2908211 RepID=UPI001F2B6265|nr:ATP-binding protein [Jeotgalibaca sp. MA1X17-3]UJF15503.1 cell wall metabolism sensor histidine kinase WalK [Jeotgalibaca sp. MA1X17-3]